jgi:predicted TIM-barrel fold metal-dependent hydrolase
MSIEEYEPKSTLVVPQNHVPAAKFPFIDVHNHQRNVTPESARQLLGKMDELNMRILVNSPVNGGSGEWVRNAVGTMKSVDKDRFAAFTNIDFKDIPNAAAKLEQDIGNGAAGLKVWRNLGMGEKDASGKFLAVDDPSLDPVWQMCAKHGIPVLIHTADPKPLFEPMDKHNERWLELKLRPGRSYAPHNWDELIAAQHRLFERHPKTTFIAAHMGWLANDLGRLGAVLDRCPNVNVEIGAIFSELGRQPRAARAFFVKYQDRVLFGKDRWAPEEYPLIFRLLETEDDYFEPIRKYHGLWKLYGLGLPDAVLRKLYYKNALRLIPGLNATGFPD